jgi:hypothetical protein
MGKILYASAPLLPDGRPNYSKRGPKIMTLAGKIGGGIIPNLGKKWQKRGRKTFLQKFRRETV